MKITLVYWSLMPQQQPWSYQGSDDDDEMSVSLVEETEAPGGNHRSMASNWQTFTHVYIYGLWPVLGSDWGHSDVRTPLSSLSYRGPLWRKLYMEIMGLSFSKWLQDWIICTCHAAINNHSLDIHYTVPSCEGIFQAVLGTVRKLNKEGCVLRSAVC